MLCDLEQVSYGTSLTLAFTHSVKQGDKIGSAPSPWEEGWHGEREGAILSPTPIFSHEDHFKVSSGGIGRGFST